MATTIAFSAGYNQAGEWTVVDTGEALSGESLQYVKKIVKKKSDTASFFANKAVFLTLFDAKAFNLKVIDNGAGKSPLFSGVPAAMQAKLCPAGVNGGFFLKDYRPSGLQIAEGQRVGQFGTAKLLSGVVYTDGKGNIHLQRRAEFKDQAGITDLIQAGPFLVDRGNPVAGLSKENPRRRTFILTDGKSKWALGLCDSMTLSELSEVLSMPGFVPGIKVHRALNLDGGTSSGIYFDTGAGNSDVYVSPIKRVRNFLGVSPR